MNETDILMAARRFVATHGLEGAPNEGVAVEVAAAEMRGELRRRLIVQAMYPEGELRFVERVTVEPMPRVVEVLQRAVATEDVPDAWLDVPLIDQG